MFGRVENWHYSSYLQIRFIESILNTAGAAKSPIYHKHLISFGSEGLELAFLAPVLVASFHSSNPSTAPNASAPVNEPFGCIYAAPAGVIYSEQIVLRGWSYCEIARLDHGCGCRWGREDGDGENVTFVSQYEKKQIAL